MKKAIKTSVNFKRAEIQCAQLKILSLNGLPRSTVVFLDGKLCTHLTRIEIVIDARKPMAEIALFMVPMLAPKRRPHEGV